MSEELKTLKNAMIELINKSVEFEESFVFEKLQGYMDLSDTSNPKWVSNVRIRMLEIHEAIENEKQRQRQAAIKHWKQLNEDREGQLGSDAAYTDGQMEWIELFFDLTREDFK